MIINDMPDYANTKIYKVINLQDESKIYVGSTCNRLCQRMALHRRQAKDETDKLHIHMQEIGCKNFKIILIENYPCSSKDEKTAHEQYWIDQLHPYYNTNHAFITEEQKREHQKKYNLDHKKEIKQHNHQYNKTHANEIKQYKQQHKMDFKCEKCNFIGDKGQYNRHCKSKKHIINLKNKNDI